MNVKIVCEQQPITARGGETPEGRTVSGVCCLVTARGSWFQEAAAPYVNPF